MVVTQLYVYLPAAIFSRIGRVRVVNIHMAWVFYFACSMIPGNAKASRRGTSGEFGTTLFLLYKPIISYRGRCEVTLIEYC